MSWSGWWRSIRGLGDVSKVMPTDGQSLVWNTTTLQYEPAILASGPGYGYIPGIEKFTATEGQTKFTLSFTFKANSCHVFLNGILEEKDVDYTETDTRSSITFAVGLTAGNKVEVHYAV